mmetsp:Transcript_4946/g.10829  ORF Transcript_4946/g.10829 Transcript_4946/m.10829 type:complete len:81 (+) Transcript_4946:979-1221(+)
MVFHKPENGKACSHTFHCNMVQSKHRCHVEATLSSTEGKLNTTMHVQFCFYADMVSSLIHGMIFGNSGTLFSTMPDLSLL